MGNVITFASGRFLRALANASREFVDQVPVSQMQFDLRLGEDGDPEITVFDCAVDQYVDDLDDVTPNDIIRSINSTYERTAAMHQEYLSTISSITVELLNPYESRVTIYRSREKDEGPYSLKHGPVLPSHSVRSPIV